MKSFFRKKFLFATLFTILLFLFSGWNFWSMKDVLKSIWQEYGQVRSFADATQFVTKIEEGVVEHLLGKIKFIEGYGFIQSVLGKEESNNFAFIKDQQDFMHYGAFYQEDDKKITEYAKRLRRMQDYVKPKGTKVMFIAPPGKNMYGKSVFAEGLPVDDVNYVVDELLLRLHENKVPTLDLRENFRECPLPYEDVFFKTDHHWTGEAGLYATMAIIDAIEEAFQDNWDPENYYRDSTRYHTYRYPNAMVGSMGRRSGINYSGTEDFVLVWPDYEGDFEWNGVKQSGTKISKKGTFSETFLMKENLTNSNPYGEGRYGTYLSVLTSYDHIVNKDNIEGPKVLFIRDSYFSTVIPFLAPMCSEIESFWSLNPEGEMDIDDWLTEHEYDYIFVEIYPDNIEDAAFSFFREE